MTLSASADHSTAVLHHEPRWEPPRRGLGIAGLCLSGCGLAIFIYYFSTHAHNPQVTGQAIGWAALAVALTPSGLIVGRWGFGSQRAADTRRAFVEDIVAMYDRVEDLGEKVDGLIALTAQAAHEAKAPAPEQRAAEPEAKPVPPQQAPRQRKRRRRSDNDGETNVVPLRSRRAADALRRLQEHINDSTDK
jgi:hypothetical protein